jgi:hypothetical protein
MKSLRDGDQGSAQDAGGDDDFNERESALVEAGWSCHATG